MSDEIPEVLQSLLPLYVGEDGVDSERPFNQLPNVWEQLIILGKVERDIAQILNDEIANTYREYLGDKLASKRLLELQARPELGYVTELGQIPPLEIDSSDDVGYHLPRLGEED